MEDLYEDVVVRLEDEDGRAAGGRRRGVLLGGPLVRHQVLVAHVAVRVFKITWRKSY